MTTDELAKQLTGFEYPFEPIGRHTLPAKEAGLVIVFGASDDLMEFRGAIYDEVGACDGGTALIDKEGLLPERNQIDNDDELDNDENDKDDETNNIVSFDNERTERSNHFTGIALTENQSR